MALKLLTWPIGEKKSLLIEVNVLGTDGMGVANSMK